MSPTKSNTSVKHGVKRSRSVDVVGRGADDPKSKQIKVSPSTHTAQLSGATRNMRFMQRGKTANSVTTRHSYSPKSSTISTELTTKEEVTNKTSDGDVNARQQSDHTIDDSMEIHGVETKKDISIKPKSSISNNNIEWEKATPLDMFGHDTCIVLGRRSYNGFNSITASNLYMQQQHLEYEEKLKQRRTSTRGGTKQISSTGKSDQQRYKELSKQVQKEKKPTLVSKNGGKVSNKNMRNLDEILKSVDASQDHLR